jgi:BirA family biotin operon repressor/biotin-[acetyl-CoA-carboxylase] ligase
VYNVLMDLDLLGKTLSSLSWISFRYFEKTTSTNDAALEWLNEGCSEYSLIVAESQTQGRGRLNRKWFTQPGSALAFSLVLFPMDNEIAHLALFSPLGAVAVSQALETTLDLHPQIKWPNDVLLNHKKTCGILSEAHWQQDHLRGVILGIGVNVSPSSVPDKDQVQFPATCIENAAKSEIDRVELLRAILKNLYEWRPLVGSPQFHKYWMGHLAFQDEKVIVQINEKESVSGILRTVAQDGSLAIELESGKLANFMIGDVHLRSGGE